MDKCLHRVSVQPVCVEFEVHCYWVVFFHCSLCQSLSFVGGFRLLEVIVDTLAFKCATLFIYFSVSYISFLAFLLLECFCDIAIVFFRVGLCIVFVVFALGITIVYWY